MRKATLRNLLAMCVLSMPLLGCVNAASVQRAELEVMKTDKVNLYT